MQWGGGNLFDLKLKRGFFTSKSIKASIYNRTSIDPHENDGKDLGVRNQNLDQLTTACEMIDSKIETNRMYNS